MYRGLGLQEWYISIWIPAHVVNEHIDCNDLELLLSPSCSHQIHCFSQLLPSQKILIIWVVVLFVFLSRKGYHSEQIRRKNNAPIPSCDDEGRSCWSLVYDVLYNMLAYCFSIICSLELMASRYINVSSSNFATILLRCHAQNIQTIFQITIMHFRYVWDVDGGRRRHIWSH